MFLHSSTNQELLESRAITENQYYGTAPQLACEAESETELSIAFSVSYV